MATSAKGSAEGGDKRDEQGSQNGAVSAIELLEQDHREVEGFFQEYEGIDDQSKKEALALKICLALQVHAQIEEEIFYPQARQVIANPDLVDEATVEHASAKQLIAEIEAMEVGDSLHDAKVKVLGEQINHHIEEEEGALFPEVEDSKMDLQSLGRRMVERKIELLEELAQEGEIR